MKQSFNVFDKYEIPTFILCNPNKDQLFSMGEITDRNLKLRFNALSELSFQARSKTSILKETGEEIIIDTPYFDYLDYKRLVYVENIGYFMISSMNIEDNGLEKIKNVTALSLECEFNFKKITNYKRTSIKFYDDGTSVGHVQSGNGAPGSLMYELMQYAPNWVIGYVDMSLYGMYRGFDVSDTTLYSFLMNDVSQTFQCIFEFNTMTRTVNIYPSDKATTPTDIYLSFDNLIESTKLQEITDELVTALNVVGGGELDISTVNPLGTTTIYNFDYYMTGSGSSNPSRVWMSESLISTLNAWNKAIKSYQPDYAKTLTILKNIKQSLLVAQNTLADATAELKAKEGVLAVKIQQKLNTKGAWDDVHDAQNAVNNAQINVNTIQVAINVYENHLISINNTLSFNGSYWTTEKLKELDNFIIGSTYTNANFIQTQESTPVQVQAMAQELYDQAVKVLAKISQPRYTFEVTSANFILLKDFEKFTNQLALGCTVTIDRGNGLYTIPALLGIDYNYDDPSSFNLIFSNRLRLDDNAFQFSDLFGQSINSGITTTFNSESWGNWNVNRSNVIDFITSSLNATTNAIISGSDQEVTIDQNGIRGRKKSQGYYSPNEYWFINNTLAFTNDGWKTSKLALGEIPITIDNGAGDGSSNYGLIADAIYGKLLVGANLIIENEKSTFRVDGNGASIRNGRIFLSRDDNLNTITLDPVDGITVTKTNSNTGQTEKTFYLNDAGDIVFRGNLSGASGTFSGSINAQYGKIGMWDISKEGLESQNGIDYIRGNGDVKLGALTITSSTNPAVATFMGNIYANNLVGQITGSQIESIIADTITSGTINSINIFGSNISWPGVRMFSPAMGFSSLMADGFLTLSSGESGIGIQPNGIHIASPNVTIGSSLNPKSVDIIGNLSTTDTNFNKGTGKTMSITVGEQTLNFVNGILIDLTSSGSLPGSGIVSGSYIDPTKVIFGFEDDEQGWVKLIDQKAAWEPNFLTVYKELGSYPFSGQWKYTISPSQSWKITATSYFSVKFYTYLINPTTVQVYCRIKGISTTMYAVDEVYFSSNDGYHNMSVNLGEVLYRGREIEYLAIFVSGPVGLTGVPQIVKVEEVRLENMNNTY